MSKLTENQLTKLYYSIGEVAELFEVNTSLIRFWEKEFIFIKPKKNKKGNRLFSPKEIMKIDQIYNLVKEQGYTLDGAKTALKKGGANSEKTIIEQVDQSSIISKLENIRERLLALKN